MRLFALSVFCGLSWAALHVPRSAAAETSEPTPIYNSQEETIPMVPPEVALQRIKLPPGFQATLFAAEPDVQQPIGMTFDSRGRLWVAENYTYAEMPLNFDLRLHDRIIILEDADGDGRHDSRKVFWDGAQKLTSVAVGLGGVFAMCPPQLLFLPDRNGDDVPDGPPEVLLDGFAHDAIRHTLANGLKWGPDGWLYGRHGIQDTSHVGRPGAPPEERTAVNGSIWRYHPLTHRFELVAQGTTNPWGSDWDENGELFFINTVIGHLWHAVPGAYFKRMYGPPSNPYVYEQIDQTADHVHWDTREVWSDIRQGMSSTTSQAGGGHAHTGLLMYQEDNWPEKYRNSLFTINLHGKRINNDYLSRDGAGYVGRHGPDFMSIDDPYFRGIELLAGPEGGVYVADWSDIGECHEQNGVHRASGRIYRLTYGSPSRPIHGDLARLGNLDLVKLQSEPNECYVRQAREILRDRAVDGQNLADAQKELERILASKASAALKLRALWCLYVIAGANPDLWERQLDDPNEHLRVWGIRLLVDQGAPSDRAVARFVRMAREDASGLVLMYLASALQKIPLLARWPLALALAERGEFDHDRFLPLMVWYGIEAAIPGSPEQTVALVKTSRMTRLRTFATRRVFEDLTSQAKAANGLIALLTANDSAVPRAEILRAIASALEAVPNPAPPAAWAEAIANFRHSDDAPTRVAADQVDAVFGGSVALEALQKRVLDRSIDSAERKRDLKIILRQRPSDTAAMLESLLGDPELAANAIEGLGSLGAPQTPATLLARYQQLTPADRRATVNTLVSRVQWAESLLQAVQRGIVTRNAITASDLRQLRQIKSPEVKTLLARIWPQSDDTSGSRQQLFAKYRKMLAQENLGHGDAVRGREVFQTVCGVCHKLYGEGGTIGPELTGGDRQNLDYLLENILNPSGVVPESYRVSHVNLKDDRALSGIVLAATPQNITLQTLTEKLLLSRAEIESIQESDLSMMPDGLLDALSDQQVLDLVRYLQSSAPFAQ